MLRKNWLIILLAALAAGLTFVWWVTRQAKEEVLAPPAKTGLEAPTSRFLEPVPSFPLAIRVAPPFLPQVVRVFSTIRFAKDNLPQPTKKLALLFDLSLAEATQSSPAEGFLVWTEGNSSLVLEVPSGRFSFSGKAPVAQGFSSAQARDFAVKTLTQAGLISRFASISVDGFVVFGDELRPAQGRAPEVFLVKIKPLLDNLPVVGAAQAQSPVEIKVNKNGELLHLSFSLHTPGGALGDFALKSWEGAVRDLQEGGTQLLWLKDEEGRPATSFSQNPLVRGEINKTFLAYFDGADAQDVFQPVFVFEGKGTTASGKERTAAFFVPALP